jgi:hypothetical protein
MPYAPRRTRWPKTEGSTSSSSRCDRKRRGVANRSPFPSPSASTAREARRSRSSAPELSSSSPSGIRTGSSISSPTEPTPPCRVRAPPQRGHLPFPSGRRALRLPLAAPTGADGPTPEEGAPTPRPNDLGNPDPEGMGEGGHGPTGPAGVAAPAPEKFYGIMPAEYVPPGGGQPRSDPAREGRFPVHDRPRVEPGAVVSHYFGRRPIGVPLSSSKQSLGARSRRPAERRARKGRPRWRSGCTARSGSGISRPRDPRWCYPGRRWIRRRYGPPSRTRCRR